MTDGEYVKTGQEVRDRRIEPRRARVLRVGYPEPHAAGTTNEGRRKHLIGYYIHHHGSGHLSRARSICANLRSPVTALTSLDLADPTQFDEVVRLPRDDQGSGHRDTTANGAMHWVPHHDEGLRLRMSLIAQWVAEARPAAVVVDVSVEVAAFVRLLGVPVIVIAMPGARTDTPHDLVYRMADHILAAWPAELAEPDWLRPHRHKTTYVGGISRFDGRDPDTSDNDGDPTVLVLAGTGGTFVGIDAVAECGKTVPDFRWRTLGVAGGPWADDPWPAICAADVVVTHAGQNCIADVAVAARPAIVIPQHRPFGEQLATADVLARHGLATVVTHWPQPRSWPALLGAASVHDRRRWERWRTRGAALRAAQTIERVADRHAVGG